MVGTLLCEQQWCFYFLEITFKVRNERKITDGKEAATTGV